MTLTGSWRVWKANLLILTPDSHRLGLLVDTVYTMDKSNPIAIGVAESPELGLRLLSLYMAADHQDDLGNWLQGQSFDP